MMEGGGEVATVAFEMRGFGGLPDAGTAPTAANQGTATTASAWNGLQRPKLSRLHHTVTINRNVQPKSELEV